jgi:zinc and cadmium transporter
MDLSSPLALSLAFGAAAAAANVVGGLVVVARRHWNEMFLKYFVGLGAGFMLAATFLRMMPASFALTSSAPVLILAGYFLVQFFEHTLAPHFHFGEERHDEVMMNPGVGISALVGLSIHTFFDGVSIASGFLISAPLGLLIFFAVVLHKIPEGMSRFTGAVGYALPLSTGVTLYVAASDLIPEVNEERGLRMPLVVFLGVALFYVTEHLLDALTG